MHLPSFLSLGPSAGSPAHIASVLHARGVHSPGRGSVLSVNVVYKLMPALCCRGR